MMLVVVTDEVTARVGLCPGVGRAKAIDGKQRGKHLPVCSIATEPIPVGSVGLVDMAGGHYFLTSWSETPS